MAGTTYLGSLGRRDALLGVLAAAGVLGPSRRLHAAEPVRVGILVDISRPFADYSGPTSVVAARMAAAEVGTVLGRPVEVIAADPRTSRTSVPQSPANGSTSGASWPSPT